MGCELVSQNLTIGFISFCGPYWGAIILVLELIHDQWRWNSWCVLPSCPVEWSVVYIDKYTHFPSFSLLFCFLFSLLKLLLLLLAFCFTGYWLLLFLKVGQVVPWTVFLSFGWPVFVWAIAVLEAIQAKWLIVGQKQRGDPTTSACLRQASLLASSRRVVEHWE